MTTTAETRFCSVCARQAGLDPAGYAGTDYAMIIAIEVPLPWPRHMLRDPERIPADLLAVLQQAHAAYEHSGGSAIRMLGIAPDTDYSLPGLRRVICWRRPAGPFAQFEQHEYLVPEAQLGPLVRGLILEPEQLAEFAAAAQGTAGMRDLLVCTHGSVDAACAKFGYPTYRHLRTLAAEAPGALRVWRSTHIGGHVFAPTLLDLPHGSYWAYIEGAQAEQLVQRSGDPAQLHRHYRGWTGLPAPFLQVLERELLIEHGWEWLNYAKSGRILAQDEDAPADDEPRWAEVALSYCSPAGVTGTVVARIEQTSPVATIYRSGEPDTYAYPQYSVIWRRGA